jgi:hypothetical protein
MRGFALELSARAAGGKIGASESSNKASFVIERRVSSLDDARALDAN